MADIKIPFKYCKIDRAAKLLNCETEDLIHLAANNKIELCINLYSNKGILHFFCDYEKIKSIEKEIYNSFKNSLSGVYTISDAASSSFLFPQISHAYIDEFDVLQICVEGNSPYSYLAEGIANGLWALDSLTLRQIECFGEANVSNSPLNPASKSNI